MKKNSCMACRFKKDGVKTRKAIVHTCGKYIKELPPIEENKQYIVSCDLYDDTYGPGTIMVMSKTEDGRTLMTEYFTQVKVKDFKKEVERISKYYNTEPIYDWVTVKIMQSDH